VIVDANNVAHRIDAGAGLRYRAKGQLKTHINGYANHTLTDMHDPRMNKWIAKVTRGLEVAPDDPSMRGAMRVAQVPDDTIRVLVDRYGPSNKLQADQLARTIIRRKANIAKAYA
jgi:hypothetical protein